MVAVKAISSLVYNGNAQVDVQSHYDRESKTFSLCFNQSCPVTPGQSNKQPFYIPIKLGLVGPDGNDLPLNQRGDQNTQFSPFMNRIKHWYSKIYNNLRYHHYCVVSQRQ